MWPDKPKLPNQQLDRMDFMLTLRRRGITDAAVLRAMEEVPREMFVPEHLRAQAYEDYPLPIDCGQTISQPYIVAYMTELLELQTRHRVLEIGTGSGYQAAVISRIAATVVSIERYRRLAERARKTFDMIGYTNIEVISGDGLDGTPHRGPYDRIIVTAAAPSIPDSWVDQLADNGILLLPLGPQDGPQRIVRFRKSGGEIIGEDLIPVRFVPVVPGQAKEL